MLRIGIACYPSYGGSGVIATELGKMLAEKGHHVHFIAYDIPFRLSDFHQNIQYHEVEANQYALFKYPPYDLSLASKMAQVAKSNQLDLIHVHYAVPHAVAAILAKQMVGDQLKVVTTLHGTDITILGEDASLRDIINFGITQSDAVTAVSNNLVSQTMDLVAQDQEIHCIPNFVDDRIYYPRDVSLLRRQYAAPHEAIFLHISNFRPVKRLEDVIKIFANVLKRYPSRLLLVGEGPEWERAQAAVNRYSIASRVVFLGKQSEVSHLISLADLLLLPSEKESFGLVALEAMACGVPVISSDAGGLPEVIVHGVTGFLSKVGDTASMSMQALFLLQNKSVYQSFSRAAIQHVRQKFSAEQIVRRYEELYYQVLAKKR